MHYDTKFANENVLFPELSYLLPIIIISVEFAVNQNIDDIFVYFEPVLRRLSRREYKI